MPKPTSLCANIKELRLLKLSKGEVKKRNLVAEFFIEQFGGQALSRVAGGQGVEPQ